MSEKKLTGTFYGTTREDEEKKLRHVKEVAEEKLNGIKKNAANLQEELKSLREVYDVEDKEGLAQWFNTDARFKEVRNDMRRAERAGKKPFFGRIDIEDDENKKRETFYIGKKDKKISFYHGSNHCGKSIVITNLDFMSCDGVVFINNRNNAHIKKRLEGIGGVNSVGIV